MFMIQIGGVFNSAYFFCVNQQVEHILKTDLT